MQTQLTEVCLQKISTVTLNDLPPSNDEEVPEQKPQYGCRMRKGFSVTT